MNERIPKLDMLLRKASTALAVIFLLSYQIVPSSADLVHISIEEMTEKADVILIGTVENVLHSAASPYTILHMHRQRARAPQNRIRQHHEPVDAQLLYTSHNLQLRIGNPGSPLQRDMQWTRSPSWCGPVPPKPSYEPWPPHIPEG